MLGSSKTGFLLAGAAAGTVNGLLGAGGGMLLVPLLTMLTDLEEDGVFPASVAIIAPLSLVSLIFTALFSTVAWIEAIPYLLGGSLGGLAAGKWGKKIPVKWLHRVLGILILWGAFRTLCAGS